MGLIVHSETHRERDRPIGRKLIVGEHIFHDDRAALLNGSGARRAALRADVPKETPGFSIEAPGAYH